MARNIIESKDSLRLESRIGWGARIFLGVAGLIPLLAPYELLIKPRWNGHYGGVFLFMTLIALGACSISFVSLWAALTGSQGVADFQKHERVLSYKIRLPLGMWYRRQYVFEDIQRFWVKTLEWSEGEPSYQVMAELVNGKHIRLGSMANLAEAEMVVGRLVDFLDRPMNTRDVM